MSLLDLEMKRQRTLLDCVGSSSKSTASSREGATKRAKGNGDSCDHRVETQQNSIVVDQPLGATTIIINNSSCALVPTESELPDISHGEASQEQLATDKAPSDLASSPDHPPCQPNTSCPTTLVGGKQRCFNTEWYGSYSWLEYSVQKDGAFCYPCRLFTTTGRRSHNTFTKVGFHDWKHATGKGGILNVHDKCSTHLDAMVAWSQYNLNAKHHSSIAQRMESNWAEIISNNRHYLKALIEVILLCAHQEIGLRGHREFLMLLTEEIFLKFLPWLLLMIP